MSFCRNCSYELLFALFIIQISPRSLFRQQTNHSRLPLSLNYHIVHYHLLCFNAIYHIICFRDWCEGFVYNTLTRWRREVLLITIWSSLCRQQVRVLVNKTRTEAVYNPFNKQPELTAFQGAIRHLYDFTILKQDFEKKQYL